MIDFVNKFGPLNTNPGNLITTRVLGLPGFMGAGGDSIGEVIRQAKSMAKLVSGYKSDFHKFHSPALKRSSDDRAYPA